MRCVGPNISPSFRQDLKLTGSGRYLRGSIQVATPTMLLVPSNNNGLDIPDTVCRISPSSSICLHRVMSVDSRFSIPAVKSVRGAGQAVQAEPHLRALGA